MAPATKKKASSSKVAAKKAVKADNPRDAEQVSEAQASPYGHGPGPANDEVRVGLATGSHAGNPDIPDKLPINTSVEGVKPDEPTSAALSVAVKDDGKKGPAA